MAPDRRYLSAFQLQRKAHGRTAVPPAPRPNVTAMKEFSYLDPSGFRLALLERGTGLELIGFGPRGGERGSLRIHDREHLLRLAEAIAHHAHGPRPAAPRSFGLPGLSGLRGIAGIRARSPERVDWLWIDGGRQAIELWPEEALAEIAAGLRDAAA